MHEASLVAAKKYYKRCTQAAIVLGTVLAACSTGYIFVTIVFGGLIFFGATVTGGTVENRAYCLAHDKLYNKTSPPKP